MKKWIALLLLLAVLISCCACAGESANQETTEPSGEATEEVTETTEASGISADLSPEALYGHIDQTKPMDGIYKIWNKDGVLNMVNDPAGSFEILCDIDMEGAVMTPIGSVNQPFTGSIKGGNYTVSNFTVAGGGDGAFGLVAVNKGKVRNVVLDNVTFQPDAAAKDIGSLAGINEGQLTNCIITNGTMAVEAAAEGANVGGIVGTNTGEVSITKVTVDVTCTAPGAANVGGVAGYAEGGTLKFVDTNGALVITGSNKTAGLFAGTAKNVNFNSLAFVGAANTVDGVLFTNFAGTEENVVAEDCVWRDNDKEEISPESRALRDKVVQAIYDLGSVKWKVRQDVTHSCYCQLSSCHGSYSTQYTYYGVPYNHKCSPTARMEYCIDEEGYLKDWVYDLESLDGFDMYFGTDCTGAILQAWWTVSNSVNFYNTGSMGAYYGWGTIPVGDYEWNMPLSSKNYTDVYIEATDEQVMYEAYGQMRAGDAYVYRIDVGGHARMAAEDAVVVRNQDGLINPEYSYVISHEQGASYRNDETKEISTFRLGYKYTFANLYYDWAIPVTIEELITGEMEPVECELVGGCDGYAGMFTGTVETNYCIVSVDINLTDSKGNVVLNKPMFATSTSKYTEFGSNDVASRSLTTDYDMGYFATCLRDISFAQGETYHYTFTVNLTTGDSIQIKDGFFEYGVIE